MSDLTDGEARFVKEFLVDRDPPAAAMRAGVARINVKKTVAKWMTDPRILGAIQTATDAMSVEEMISPQRIIAGFIAVAFDPMAPHAAKNSALRELASIRKMYDDNEGKRRSGVMLVPVAGTLDDWAELAETAQSKLKDDVRH